MSTHSPNPQAAEQAALQMLSQGNARGAHDVLTPLLTTGRGGVSAWLAMAMACYALKDPRGCDEALDRVLAADPANLRALIMKGDVLAQTGDMRAASSFYRTALRAVPPNAYLPPDMTADLARIRARCDELASAYENFLREKLDAAGFDAKNDGDRIGLSLDLMLGKKQIYLQEPKFFYFPGLPQIQFYERAMFPWMDAVEATTVDIREELLGLLADKAAFAPYVTGDAKGPQRDYRGLLNNADWSACYLWKNGAIVPENAGRCPRTMEALKHVPSSFIETRAPNVLFSLLKPGAKIPPHNGFINTRLICHLPLIVPEKCGFRVGNDVRAWQEGKIWAFDDTIEHEAWNGSDQTRVILLFEIWRPEISPEERKLLSVMFSAMASHNGRGVEWTS